MNFLRDGFPGSSTRLDLCSSTPLNTLYFSFIGLTLFAIIYVMFPFSAVWSMKTQTAAFLVLGAESGYGSVLIDWLFNNWAGENEEEEDNAGYFRFLPCRIQVADWCGVRDSNSLTTGSLFFWSCRAQVVCNRFFKIGVSMLISTWGREWMKDIGLGHEPQGLISKVHLCLQSLLEFEKQFSKQWGYFLGKKMQKTMNM